MQKWWAPEWLKYIHLKNRNKLFFQIVLYLSRSSERNCVDRNVCVLKKSYFRVTGETPIVCCPIAAPAGTVRDTRNSRVNQLSVSKHQCSLTSRRKSHDFQNSDIFELQVFRALLTTKIQITSLNFQINHSIPPIIVLEMSRLLLFTSIWLDRVPSVLFVQSTCQCGVYVSQTSALLYIVLHGLY